MAENKKSIIVYADWIDKFEALDDAEAGRLIKHFFRYVNDLNPVAPDRITELTFIDIKKCLKRDLDKWEEIKEKRSFAGKISADKRQQKATNSTSVESVEKSSTNPTVSVSVNDSVNVSVNDILLKKETKKNIDIRKIDFKNELRQYVEKYTAETVTSFFDYWSERNPSGTKMKFELEKTFEISLRLNTWKKNESKFNNGNKLTPKDQRADDIAKHKAELFAVASGSIHQYNPNT